MTRKRRKQASYDIRPKTAKVRKRWSELSSSTKSYWRSKLDVRPSSVRRLDPLDRIRTSTGRAQYTRTEYLSPYQRRIVRDTGVKYIGGGGQKPRVPTPDVSDKVEAGRKTPVTYGYDAEDFANLTDHPDGYSYVLYHIFYSPSGSPRNGPSGTYITVRGSQYNTPQEVIDNWADEADEIANDEANGGREDISYVRTIVAIIPASGAERVGGAVYPRDYNPKERPGTREHEVEQGKQRLREFGPPLR